MVETWLATNRRAMLLGMLLPAAAAVGGASLAMGVVFPGSVAVRGGGWVLVLAGGAMLAVLVWQATLPRIGYEQGDLLFYLRAGPPVRVPIDIVECFLLGQGPSLLPGEAHRDEKTITVVVRLAEKADEWQRVEVKPSLASWCDGYITIRGTWCEPLDVDVVKRLNRRLAEATRKEPASG